MGRCILRRPLLIVPTLLGSLLLTFVLAQWRGGRPDTGGTTALHVASMFDRGLAPGTASQAMSAHVHRAKEAGAPCLVGRPRGRRCAASAAKEPAGERARRTASPAGTPSGWRAAPDRRPRRPARRAAILLGWCCLLRTAEIEAVDVSDISRGIKDLHGNAGFMLAVRRSRTAPECRGRAAFCPLAAARRFRCRPKASSVDGPWMSA